MSKGKIEPMAIARLGKSLDLWFNQRRAYRQELEMALGWIHAEARARHAYHQWNAALKVDHDDSMPCWWCVMRFEDWLAIVKREVGWPEDK